MSRKLGQLLVECESVILLADLRQVLLQVSDSQVDPLSAEIPRIIRSVQTTQELEGKSVVKVDHGRPRENLRMAEKPKNFKLYFHLTGPERHNRPVFSTLLPPSALSSSFLFPSLPPFLPPPSVSPFLPAFSFIFVYGENKGLTM